ncbi:MAG: hypothetical protein HOO93_05375, partial [Methyloglobulus sp.]|nr:hypothetical protein [Methyloglobulus sp.]
LIGATGSQVTSLEEKMAGNSKDHNLAFQAAESALRAGEAAVATLPYNCTNGRFKPLDKDCNKATVETVPVWESINWSVQPPAYNVGMDVLKGITDPPQFIIEQLPATGKGCRFCEIIPGGGSSTTWYRITARGTGSTANAVVTLQSIYKR